MKKLAAILFIIAYIPIIYIDGIELRKDVELNELKNLFNSMFAILIVMGVAIYSFAEFISSKKFILIPYSLLFIFIGIIFIIELKTRGTFENYYLLATTVITILLCIITFYSFKYCIQRKQK